MFFLFNYCFICKLLAIAEHLWDSKNNLPKIVLCCDDFIKHHWPETKRKMCYCQSIKSNEASRHYINFLWKVLLTDSHQFYYNPPLAKYIEAILPTIFAQGNPIPSQQHPSQKPPHPWPRRTDYPNKSIRFPLNKQKPIDTESSPPGTNSHNQYNIFVVQ